MKYDRAFCLVSLIFLFTFPFLISSSYSSSSEFCLLTSSFLFFCLFTYLQLLLVISPSLTPHLIIIELQGHCVIFVVIQNNFPEITMRKLFKHPTHLNFSLRLSSVRQCLYQVTVFRLSIFFFDLVSSFFFFFVELLCDFTQKCSGSS